MFGRWCALGGVGGGLGAVRDGQGGSGCHCGHGRCVMSIDQLGEVASRVKDGGDRGRVLVVDLYILLAFKPRLGRVAEVLRLALIESKVHAVSACGRAVQVGQR